MNALGILDLQEYRSIRHYHLDGHVLQHVSRQPFGHTEGLEDTHAFIVRIYGACVTIKLRLTFEHQYTVSSHSKAMCQR
jgi:hypothetical protein